MCLNDADRQLALKRCSRREPGTAKSGWTRSPALVAVHQPRAESLHWYSLAIILFALDAFWAVVPVEILGPHSSRTDRELIRELLRARRSDARRRGARLVQAQA